MKLYAPSDRDSSPCATRLPARDRDKLSFMALWEPTVFFSHIPAAEGKRTACARRDDTAIHCAASVVTLLPRTAPRQT